MEFVTQSRALARLPDIDIFLGARVRYVAWLKRDESQCFLTWGRKIEVEQIETVSRQWSVPLFRIEDGFISYLRHPRIINRPFSLVVDRTGIYYDSTKTSDLEDILNTVNQNFEKYKQKRSQSLIQKIRRLRVSKYNHQHKRFCPDDQCKQRILLIDQAYQDRSVYFAEASEATFQRMVEDAIRDHPSAALYVKIHPDALLGGKQSYLVDKLPPSVRILPPDLNVWSVLEHMDEIYTVSSQMGFEALMLCKKVHCYGKAFYAGWGLTEDQFEINRRKSNLTLEQLVYAALICYPIYLHPASSERCELEDVLDYLEIYLRPDLGYYNTIYPIGMSLWKRGFLRRFLKGHYCQHLHFKSKAGKLPSEVPPDSAALIWGYKNKEDLAYLASLGLTILRAEDGFIRSVGLGSDLRLPSSLVISRDHLYYFSSRPTQLEDDLSHRNLDENILDRAEKLIVKLRHHKISKYNLGGEESISRPNHNHVCLVLGQVPDDASLTYGGDGIQSDAELLRVVRQQMPNAHIYYKPHPDVVAGNRPAMPVSKEDYDVLIKGIDIISAFAIADSIHVISSLSGFEALIHGKTVYTYGRPFYAGWGLTIDTASFATRRRRLSLAQLVAVTMIIHPMYFDWQRLRVSGPEEIIESIIDHRSKHSSLSIASTCWQRNYRKARYLIQDTWGHT